MGFITVLQLTPLLHLVCLMLLPPASQDIWELLGWGQHRGSRSEGGSSGQRSWAGTDCGILGKQLNFSRIF